MSDEDPVEAAWADVEARWGEPEVHKRFVALCLTMGRLPDAGGRYRKTRDENPERKPEADKQLAAILAAATVALYESKTAPPKRHDRVTLFAVAFAAALILGALWAWLRAR